MQSVYIETTIPSFYYEIRTTAEFVAMRNWTRLWWNESRKKLECYTSEAVFYELESGEHPQKEEKLTLIKDIMLLEITDEIREIVEVYLENYLMPREELGDALHLAVASCHKMDYLLTWNCSHLANANKRMHVRRINEKLRIHTPEILTPLELMEF
jgi:predicted nucleic acid-binding protein